MTVPIYEVPKVKDSQVLKGAFAVAAVASPSVPMLNLDDLPNYRHGPSLKR